MKAFIPNKTLVIRLSSIGDIVLTTPFLRSFKKQFPHCRVDYVVKKEFADLLRYNPYIDHLYEFNSDSGFAGLRRFVSELRQQQYDLIVDLHNSLRSKYIRRRVRAKKVRRISKREIQRFLLIKFKMNVYRNTVHVVDRYIETVEDFGVRNDNDGLELIIPEHYHSHVAEQFEPLKQERRFLVAICPAAKHYTKRWLKEYYVKLSEMLIDTCGVYIVILGGPEDKAYCEDIRRLIGVEHAVNVAGELKLLQSAAVLDQCDVVVTNDTGMMHIAAARKRKIVAIFGPTVRELGFFPYGTENIVVEHDNLSCRPCTHIGSNSCPKGHFRCMRDLLPTRVYEATERMLRGVW